MSRPPVREMARGILAGRRSYLAQAISLVESHLPRHRVQASDLFRSIVEERSTNSSQCNSLRIGISGPPGAGKSTFIEGFGKFLTARGHKLAVLAIDPSSIRTGGSILGDKTRMNELSRDPNAYVRPIPSGGYLGGVSHGTSEAVRLCEAAGYDVVIVETVGAGQSEVSVADMTDLFTLVVPPAAGDELQGIKKGIVEHADLILVNKSDGHLMPAANMAKADFVSAVKILRARTDYWRPQVLAMSSKLGVGFEEVWTSMQDYRGRAEAAGDLDRRRLQQRDRLMWAQVQGLIMPLIRQHPNVKSTLTHLSRDPFLSAGACADALLNAYAPDASLHSGAFTHTKV